jgi:hypothetical protein
MWLAIGSYNVTILLCLSCIYITVDSYINLCCIAGRFRTPNSVVFEANGTVSACVMFTEAVMSGGQLTIFTSTFSGGASCKARMHPVLLVCIWLAGKSIKGEGGGGLDRELRALYSTVVIQQAVIGGGLQEQLSYSRVIGGGLFYCCQTIILLLPDQSCSKPLPINFLLTIAVPQCYGSLIVVVSRSSCDNEYCAIA